MSEKLKATITEGLEQIAEGIKLLEHVRMKALQAVDLIDSTPFFKKKLRERIAAGEYALRAAVEDLKRSILNSKKDE